MSAALWEIYAEKESSGYNKIMSKKKKKKEEETLWLKYMEHITEKKNTLSFLFLQNDDRFDSSVSWKDVNQIYMVTSAPGTGLLLTFSVSHLPWYLLYDAETFI